MNFEIKTVANESFEMEYIKFGSGKRAIAVVPGISFFSASVSAASVAGAYSAFGEKFTIYLFDRKKNIQSGYSIEQMAEDTAAAMKAAGIEKACVFGASQGGMIAQCIAINHPEAVEKLFIASSFSKVNDTFIENIEKTESLIEKCAYDEMTKLFFSLVYSESYMEKCRNAFDFISRMCSKEDINRFRFLMEACRNFDISDRLKNITCPAFAIGSKEDKMLTGEATAEIAQGIGCDYYLYDGYSHAVYDEAPDFKKRIMDFFED